MSSNSNNKRRRTAAVTHISHLPIGIIVDVSAYLPKPSRAILAVAMSAPSSSWQNNDLMHRPSNMTKAIISASQQWDILDFEDVNNDLAHKLTDDDIYAILKCISAQDVIKILKLCGCINIEGHGLKPLQGSVVLEQIDISLVTQYVIDEILWPCQSEPKISHEVVVPILDSIISVDGCSLKYIQFPQKWCPGRRTRIPQVHRFIERYNEQFIDRDIICSKCNEDMNGNGIWMDDHTFSSERMGTVIRNKKICYECLEPACRDCADGPNDERFFLLCCTYCEKTYCSECVPVLECSRCSDKICRGCEIMKACDDCGEICCEKCLNTCDVCNKTRCEDCAGYNHCGPEDYKCRKAHCTDCYNGKEYDVRFCEECQNMCCSSCNLKLIKKNGMECCACAPDIVPLMLEENAKLSKENTKQKEEFAKLRKENEELRGKESMEL